MRNRIICALMVALVSGIAGTAIPARATITIGVSPSIVELSGKPGSTGEFELTLLNQGDEPFDALVASQQYDRVDPNLSVPEWLMPSVNSAHLEPGATSTVKISIAIPKDAGFGGRYAAISVTTGAPNGQTNSTAISGKLIVPFLITVEGKNKIKRVAEFNDFAAVLELDGRLGFRADVINDGNIHWKSSGKSIISNSDGSDYGNLDFEETTIFPQSSGVLSTTSSLPIKSGGTYKAIAAIDYGAKKPMRAETEFTFVPKLAVSGGVCENLDRGPTLTTDLVNTGSLGIVAVASMAIVSADGQPIGQTGVMGPYIAWPDSTATIGTDLSERLQTGDYTLTIQVQTGASADPIVQEIPFSIGGTGPNVAPICPQPEATPGA